MEGEVFSWQSPASRLVLDAVLDSLAEAGCRGLSVDEIRRRSGAAGPVLEESPDLDALVIAALEHVHVFAAPAPTGDLRRDLRELLEPWRGPLSKNERVVAALLSAAMWSPRLKVAMHEAFDRPLMNAVSTVVATAQRNGQIPAQAVHTLCWVLRGLMVDRLRSRPRAAVDIEFLIDFLMAGLQLSATNGAVDGAADAASTPA
jgi:hypothetical protein